MCGRFTLAIEAEQLAKAFELAEVPPLPPRYNIAPTQPVPAIRREGDRRVLVDLKWGLVPWWAEDRRIGHRLINARKESAARAPAFRDAFASRRCIIPATGFYEWRAEGGRKQPYLVRRADHQPLGFAGLWESWRGPEGRVETCTILTTGASRDIRALHDRMPVILPPGAYGRWLDPTLDPAGDSLALEPPELEATPVSPAVNDPKHEGPDCIEPLAAN